MDAAADQISVRDSFAMSLSDEAVEAIQKDLNRLMEQMIVGEQYDQPAKGTSPGGVFRPKLYELYWDLRVKAALRFMYADAMLKARDKSDYGGRPLPETEQPPQPSSRA